MLRWRLALLPLAVLLLARPGAAAHEPPTEMLLEAQDQGSAFWFTSNATGSERNPMIHLAPGAHVVITVVNKGPSPHNLRVSEPVDVATPILSAGERARLEFDVPERADVAIAYWCDPHVSAGMEGTFSTMPAPPAAPGAEPPVGREAVTSLGVNFYAYWIGVFSFLVLFVVLGATFFLLRYAESPRLTDHRDRPAREAAAKPIGWGTLLTLAVVLVLFAVAVVQVTRLV